MRFGRNLSGKRRPQTGRTDAKINSFIFSSKMFIPDHFIPEFSSGWEHKVQQKRSRIRDYVTVGSAVDGEAHSFNQVDDTDPEEVTGERLKKTAAEELTTDRRWMYPRKFQKTVHWDEDDNIYLANQDMNPPDVVNAIVPGFERKIDQVIIEGAYGINQTGKTGSTPAMVDQILSARTGGGSLDVSLNLQKLIAAKEILTSVEAWNDDTIAAGDKPIALISPNMLSSLLLDEKLTSNQYAAVQALIDGEIQYFMGFRIVKTNRLPVDENGHTVGIFYMKSGLHFRPWKNRKIRTGENPARSFAPYVFVNETFGACRSEEAKFVFVPCAKLDI